MPISGFLRSARFYDRLEQVIVSALFLAFFIRLWPDNVSDITVFTALILFSEGVVLLLLLTRRTTEDISLDFKDWLIAAGGTWAVLLVGPGGEPFLPVAGTIFLVAGTMIHIGAKLSLRRSFGLVAANRGVRASGLYSFVRHPMYAGYMLTHLGFLMAAPTIRNFFIYAIAWVFFIMRIIAEERVLSADPAYSALKQRVRFRLVPGIY